MNRTLVGVSFLVANIAAPLHAEQYWLAWEGNDYPENEGWERRINGVGPAVRTLGDGIMSIDGRADRQIDDYYRMDRSLNPEPGELFVMQWRLRVNEVIGHPLGLYDPGVGLFSDDDNELTFVLGVDFIRSYHEDGAIIPIEPFVFHEFEVRSFDMQTYELRIDGTTARTGEFWKPNFRRSGVDWGDYTRGSASLTDWDYFRFGVVPEPSSLALILALAGGARRTCRHIPQTVRATIFPTARCVHAPRSFFVGTPSAVSCAAISRRVRRSDRHFRMRAITACSPGFAINRTPSVATS